MYARKTGSFEREHSRAGLFLDDCTDGRLGSAGYRSSTVRARGLEHSASFSDQPDWDGTPRRYTPHALRGLSPVTREPWVVDEAHYNRNTTRDTRNDARAGGGALDLGSVSHASRSRARRVDRAGFYSPNHEAWAAALSA